MVTVSFVSALEILRRLGFFDIVLPTFLVYAVVYGILDRTLIFGEVEKGNKKYPKKELNSVVAFVIALLFIGAANVLGVMSAFIPYVGLLSVLIVSFMMLGALTFGEVDKLLEKKWVKEIMLGVTAFAFVFTFGLASGWWSFSSLTEGISQSTGIFSVENLSVMLFLGVIIGVVIWITKSSGSSNSGGSNSGGSS